MSEPVSTCEMFSAWNMEMTPDEFGLLRVVVELPDLLREKLDEYARILADTVDSETERAESITKFRADAYKKFQTTPLRYYHISPFSDSERSSLSFEHVDVDFLMRYGRRCLQDFGRTHNAWSAIIALRCVCVGRALVPGQIGAGDSETVRRWISALVGWELPQKEPSFAATSPWNRPIREVFARLDSDTLAFLPARQKTHKTIATYFGKEPKIKDPIRAAMFERQLVAMFGELARWLRLSEFLEAVRESDADNAPEPGSQDELAASEPDHTWLACVDLRTNLHDLVNTSEVRPLLTVSGEGAFQSLTLATSDGRTVKASDCRMGNFPLVDAVRPYLAHGFNGGARRMALWALHRKEIWVQVASEAPQGMVVYAGGRMGLVLVPSRQRSGSFEWAVEVQSDDRGNEPTVRWTLTQMGMLARDSFETGTIVLVRDSRVLAVHLHPLLVEVSSKILMRYPDMFGLERRELAQRALEHLGSDLRLVLRDDAVHINDGWPVVQLVLETTRNADGISVALHLRFRYRFPIDDLIFAPGQGRDTVVTFANDQLVALIRDRAAEAIKLTELRESILGPAIDDAWDSKVSDPSIITEILNNPKLEDVACEWPADGPMIRRAVLKKLELVITKSASNVDLLAISGNYVDGDASLSLSAMVDAVANNRRFARTNSGVWLEISAEMRKLLMQLASGQTDGGEMTIGDGDAFAAILGQHGDLSIRIDSAVERFLPSLERLAEAEALLPTIPSAVTTELRDYQVEGFNWLTRLAAWAHGGILGDDMGLGKTLQAIAFIVSRAAGGPTLIVVPKSLVSQWDSQIHEHVQPRTFEIRCLRSETERNSYLNGGARVQGPNTVVITTYDQVRLMADGLASIEWHTVIIDEAHNLRNAVGRRHGAMLETLSRRHSDCFVLAMTGTPLVNRVADIEALMRLVTGRTFRFAGGDEDARSIRKSDAFRPFFKRRRKEEVAKDLPALTQQTVLVELSDDERRTYQVLHQEACEATEAGPGDFGKVLALFTTMRQFVCDPRITQGAGWTEPGSKLAVVVDTITTLIDAGRPCLVFSSFTTVLDLLATALNAGLGVGPLARIDGRMKTADRQQAVEDFQAGRADVFLISLMAGGEGLNLTRATDVILVNPWWNQAADQQAVARAHRIGQKSQVTAWRFIAQDTIEEQMVALAAEKLQLVGEIVEFTAKLPALTHDTILKVLAG